MSDMDVTLPSYAQQERIATALDIIALKENQEATATLEAMTLNGRPKRYLTQLARNYSTERIRQEFFGRGIHALWHWEKQINTNYFHVS